MNTANNPSSGASSAPALALARALDLSLPSNQQAVAGLAAGLLLGRLAGQSWTGSLRTGLGTFAAWTLARELDPDHTESASAALVAELALSLADAPDSKRSPLEDLEELLVAFSILASLRTLSSTVGVAPTLPEQVALAVGALGAGSTDNKAAALVSGSSLLISHSREDGLGPDTPWSGVGALAAALLPAALPAHDRDSLLSRLTALAALVVAPAAIQIEEVNARNDLDTRQIEQVRVKSSRLVGTGALVLGLVAGGTRGLRPLAAAGLGVGVWALVEKRFKSTRY